MTGVTERRSGGGRPDPRSVARGPKVRVKTARKRSTSSVRWLQRQLNDPYVAAAKREGYRSRAAYKLIEMNEKYGFLKGARRVVDLGAAPGGWSQYCARKLKGKGRIIALDILDMEPIEGVEFLQGDFTEEEPLGRLLDATGHRVDLVMSDMAPNMSGMDAIDQPKAMYLAELALDLAEQVLKPGGVFLVKVFQGEGFDEFLRRLRLRFAKVTVRKPKASRSRSRETYLLASGLR